MPRRLRSVTAWRPSKPRKRATVSIPGTSKAKAELFQRLGQAFEATRKLTSPPSARESDTSMRSTAWRTIWKTLELT